MSTFVFLIIFSASVLFAHAIVMRKFPDLNDPKNIFKEQSRIRSKAFDDSSCDKQLKLFSDAFTSREAWALQLFDSWGKIESGYLDGNKFNFGHFTECLKFRHESQADNELVEGQYCLVIFDGMPSSITASAPENDVDWREIGQIFHNNSLTTINGICLPSTCSTEKAVAFANSFLNQVGFHSFGAKCQTSERPELELIDIFAISLFSFFAILLILSTSYDVILTNMSLERNKCLAAFSVYTNGRKLFDCTRPTSKNSIDCLLGLRAISVFWIMFGHRFTSQAAFPTRNQLVIHEHHEHIYSTIVSSYSIAVDTFFVMGALLLTVSTLNALDKKRLNVPRMILHRYLRYTPVFAVLVLFMVSLVKFMPSGPIALPEFEENCRKYWWSTLIHLQNYINPDEMCLSHGWYLSVDFQLFCISPLLIYPAWKYGWKFLCSLPALATLSSVYVMVICLVFNLKVNTSDDDEGDIFWNLIYCATQGRLGPWLIGIFLGCTLHNARDKKISVSKALNAILWILSLSALAAVVIFAQPLYVPEADTPLLANAIYIAFHRLVWAVALSWIIFACQVLKTGGIVRWFLSLPEWQPIGRMSLSMYLVHVVYQLAMLTSQKNPITFEIWSVLHLYWGDILATIGMGSILYLTFEAPILLIESYFYDLRSKKLSE